MPIYQYECDDEKHKEIHEFFQHGFKERKRKCPLCGNVMIRLISRFKPDTWKTITLEHVAEDPVTFTTKKSLRKYCKDHQLESAVLL